MKIHCPNCNQKLKFDDDLSGLTLECPRCHGQFEAKAPAAVIYTDVTQDAPPPGMLKKCNYCGKEIAKNSKICVHCGARETPHPAIVCGIAVLTFWCFLIYGCHISRIGYY